MAVRVAISGIGVIAATGTGRAAFAEALAASRPAFGVRQFQLNDRPVIPELYGAFIAPFSPADYLGPKGLRSLSVETRTFSSAAVMACRDAGFDAGCWRPEEVGVFVGTLTAGHEDYTQLVIDSLAFGVRRIEPTQGPQTGFNAPASQLAIRYKAEAANLTMAVGAASSIEAVAYAADCIRQERARIVLAGGIDLLAYSSAHEWLASASRSRETRPPRPFDRARTGPVPGEAAAVLVCCWSPPGSGG